MSPLRVIHKVVVALHQQLFQFTEKGGMEMRPRGRINTFKICQKPSCSRYNTQETSIATLTFLHSLVLHFPPRVFLDAVQEDVYYSCKYERSKVKKMILLKGQSTSNSDTNIFKAASWDAPQCVWWNHKHRLEWPRLAPAADGIQVLVCFYN